MIIEGERKPGVPLPPEKEQKKRLNVLNTIKERDSDEVRLRITEHLDYIVYRIKEIVGSRNEDFDNAAPVAEINGQ